MNFADIADYELSKELFKRREESDSHTPYSHELLVYQALKAGNVKEISRILEMNIVDKPGILSSDPLKQAMYGAICSATMATRFAVEGGLDSETAYTLSDIYIRKWDTCSTPEEIHELTDIMIIDFTKRVAKCRENQEYSKPISISINYIKQNLHYKLTLDDIAEKAKLTSKYLSQLFIKETHITITDYIKQQRIEEAQNMLKFTDKSILEISNSLCFSSQSYFISVFKSITSMTPKHYRNKYFNTNWK